jgi:hypothetical protein
MPNTKKHTILFALLEKYQSGEERTGGGRTVTDLGKSMTNIEIHAKTGIPIKEVDNLCYVLGNQGHLGLYQKDDENKAHRYLITPSGQQAAIDKYYLNQTWFRQRSFWFALIPIVLSISTLIWTIIRDLKKQEEINTIKIEVQQLKKR